MQIRKQKSLLKDSSGAVTVDFVVITAALIVLSVGALAAVRGGLDNSTDNVRRCMTIQGNLMDRDLDYKTKLARTQRRCARL